MYIFDAVDRNVMRLHFEVPGLPLSRTSVRVVRMDAAQSAQIRTMGRRKKESMRHYTRKRKRSTG